MPRDAFGTYTRAVSPYQFNTVVNPNTVNTEMDDFAVALTGSLPRSGVAGMLADLPMGGNQIVNLGVPAAASDGARRDTVGWELIATDTLASVTQWTRALPSTYRDWRIEFADLNMTAGSGLIIFRLSIDGGVTYKSGASDYICQALTADGTAIGATNANSSYVGIAASVPTPSAVKGFIELAAGGWLYGLSFGSKSGGSGIALYQFGAYTTFAGPFTHALLGAAVGITSGRVALLGRR